ncbi:MAG: hypothetical protein ACOYIF_02145 [Acetivibrionales bacterium]|jgi:hypothetical protein
MRMKIKVFVIIMIIMAILAGCGSDTENVDPSPTGTSTSENNTTNPATEKKSKYFFEYNGIAIHMNEDAKPVLEALGEPQNYFESPSCAFQGMDRIYSYNGFDLYTYSDEDDENEYVFTVAFMSDAVATTEGIEIGDKFDKVIEKYGDGYEQSGEQYVYTDENCKLSFLTKDNEVISIEYSMLLPE